MQLVLASEDGVVGQQDQLCDSGRAVAKGKGIGKKGRRNGPNSNKQVRLPAVRN
jgi:hypothetical protein